MQRQKPAVNGPIPRPPEGRGLDMQISLTDLFVEHDGCIKSVFIFQSDLKGYCLWQRGQWP